MAHLNGDIPTYQRQAGYTATINPQVPQGSPAAFGTTVAKEQAGFGENLSKLGNMLAEHAIKMQQQADDNAVVEAENEFRQQLSTVMFDPNDGYMNKKQETAKGITAGFNTWVDENLKKTLDSMPSENMKSKLLQSLGPALRQSQASIAKHEGDELYTSRVNNCNAAVSNDAAFMQQQNDINAVKMFFGYADMRIAQYRAVTGSSQEVGEQWWIGVSSPAVAAYAKSLYENGKTPLLNELKTLSEGRVDSNTMAMLNTMTADAQNRDEAYAIVDELINSGQYYTSDGISLNDAAIKEKLIGQLGPGAGHNEERQVGGSANYSGNSETDQMIARAAEKHSVDPALVAAIAQCESGYNQGALSSAGAIGVMQLMPGTADSLGVNPHDKGQNIDGGAKYIKDMLNTFNGDLTLAIAAYNAGPQAVKDHGGVPPYKETQNYVQNVLAAYSEKKNLPVEGARTEQVWVSTENPKMLQMALSYLETRKGIQAGKAQERFKKIIADLSKAGYENKVTMRGAALAMGVPEEMVGEVVNKAWVNSQQYASDSDFDTWFSKNQKYRTLEKQAKADTREKYDEELSNRLRTEHLTRNEVEDYAGKASDSLVGSILKSYDAGWSNKANEDAFNGAMTDMGFPSNTPSGQQARATMRERLDLINKDLIDKTGKGLTVNDIRKYCTSTDAYVDIKKNWFTSDKYALPAGVNKGDDGMPYDGLGILTLPDENNVWGAGGTD